MDPFLPPGHVLSAWWETRPLEPRLLLANALGVAEVEARAGGRFAVEVSRNRTCVGRWEGSRHVPCAAKAEVAGPFGQCAECGDAELEECVFEPKAGCAHPMCNAPHTVYLAFFGNLAKIGMARSGRESTRLLEQGADGYVVVARVPNRHQARDLEGRVADKLGLPQALMPRSVLAAWARAWEDAEAGKFLADVAAGLGGLATPGPLTPLRGYPMDAPLPRVRLRATRGVHAGTILGARGRFLFYRPDSGKVSAMRFTDLAARWVRTPRTL